MNALVDHSIEFETCVGPEPATVSTKRNDVAWVPADDERSLSRQALKTVPVLYPLGRLGPDHPLRRNLVVVVEEEGDVVILSSHVLRVWGVGVDVYAALSDFRSSLIGVYESYEALPDAELTQDGAEYRLLLRSYLEP